MANYRFNVLGLDVSFKAEADPVRIEQAKALLEERYDKLQQHGKQFDREKLLTFLALALADDLLQAREEMKKSKQRIRQILNTMLQSGEKTDIRT